MKKLKITVLGKTYEVLVEDMGEVTQTPVSETLGAVVPPSVPLTPVEVAPPTEVSAPMSGTVAQLSVSVGSEVRAGQALLVLEAMKMQNTIPAPKDGTVREIFIRKGDTVSSGAPLLILD